MAEATCSRMARVGRSMPAISTIVSRRARASRGVLAWTVEIEPSWPVFMAWSMSSASPPRTSPTMIRSGRMRRALRTRSRMVTSPLPSMFGGRALEPHDVVLAELQLDRVLDGDDPLVVGDERRQHVEHRGLAGAGAAGDEDVELARHAGLTAGRPCSGVSVPNLMRSATWYGLGGELADGEHRAVDRQRRDDGVDAGAVGEAGVDHRRRLVDAPADLADDALDDPAQVVLGDEPGLGALEPAVALHVDRLVAS